MDDILDLSWPELNERLLACEDEAVLRCWLDAAIAAGRATYAFRTYGRYTTVRRAREVEKIRIGLDKAHRDSKKKSEAA